MPSLVSTYEQGIAWKSQPVGQDLTALLDKRGVKIVTWVWQGGVASRSTGIVPPDDAKGLKVRGGSRGMDLVPKAAGRIISSVPSNEIYAALQTGPLDAAVTSSTSLISLRLEEVAKNVTTGRAGSFWFMFEPLLMSESIFDRLPTCSVPGCGDTLSQQAARDELWARFSTAALPTIRTHRNFPAAGRPIARGADIAPHTAPRRWLPRPAGLLARFPQRPFETCRPN